MISILVGYLLWVFISRFTTPDIIGVSATVISLVIIFSGVVDLGVSTGSIRFLGKSFSERQTADTRTLVQASLLIICSAIFVCSVAIFFFKDRLYPNIEFELVLASVPAMAMLVVSNLLRSVLVSSLETKSLPNIMIVSSISRVILTIILITLGTGAMGIIIGYLGAYLSAFVLLIFKLVTVLKPVTSKSTPVTSKSTLNLLQTCKSIFIASFPTWVSQIIGIIGANLGTLVVYGTIGASQAGSYFIALTVFYAIGSIRGSIFGIAFPVLSAMEDQRKRFAWKLIKMTLLLSLPLSFSGILYSDQVMGIIGPDYVPGSLPLKILLCSVLTSTFNIGIGTLVYSYGQYRRVLVMGLGSDLSKMVLYFVLVPLYGNLGAAMSFTIGSIIGFFVAAIIARKVGMKIFWREMALMLIIPMGLAFIAGLFELRYLIGVPVILVISLVLYVKLHLVSKSDMHEYLEILPTKVAIQIINLLNKIW